MSICKFLVVISLFLWCWIRSVFVLFIVVSSQIFSRLYHDCITFVSHFLGFRFVQFYESFTNYSLIK
jgi:hypothetical protein